MSEIILSSSLSFVHENGLLTISGTGDMTDFIYNTMPWYKDSKKIKKVVIEDGVTSIGKCAFSNCYSSLTSVTIPDSVTSIKGNAFSSCSSLTSITIPDSVTSIGGSAFFQCSSLTSVTIPDSVTSIGDTAFFWCKSLTSITIPNSVTNITIHVFLGCDKLESIEILNPDCEIYDSADTIIKKVTIYGYTGSTAQAYAEKYDRKFIALD